MSARTHHRRLARETTMLAGFGLAFAVLIAVGVVQHRSIQALVKTGERRTLLLYRASATPSDAVTGRSNREEP